MNNKGFMMAEVIVVSAVVMVTLVGLYTSYNKIFSLYNQRIDYYDINTLYELAFIRDNNIDSLVLDTKNNIGGDIIYYVNKAKVKNKTIDTDGLKKTFKEYLDYLSTSVDFDELIVTDWLIKNILIMENCTDENNCKYAYLEVIDEDSVLIPKCTLSVSGTTITASVNKDDGISYMGWDTNRISDNGKITTSIDHIGTYTFSIEDINGNVGTCGITVIATKERAYSCPSDDYSLSGTKCSKTEYKNASVSYSCSCSYKTSELCDGNGGTVYSQTSDTSCRSYCIKTWGDRYCSYYFNKNYSCGSWTKYDTSKCKRTTTINATLEPASCDGGYNLVNDNYCYKIN